MAVPSTTTELQFRQSEQGSSCPVKKFLGNRKAAFALALLLADAALVSLIIAYVPYTKIDWDAYMSQVSGFLGGERDYSNLKGDTGPLVYPAGFLYVYSAIQFVTGSEVYPAQILFGILYIINLGIVFFIYVKTDVLPWWALSLLCLSKRVHSIFVLRLFNDCFATVLLNASMAVLLSQKWHVGLIIFSAAVSIKMNVLLYAPPLLLLMLKAMDIFEVVSALACAALVQMLLGLPFLLSYPVAYISRAFNLGRIFIHFWSVNFKFVPEPVFVSKGFAVSLLAVHLMLLFTFAHYRWCNLFMLILFAYVYKLLFGALVFGRAVLVAFSFYIWQLIEIVSLIASRHEGGLFNFLHSKLLLLKLKLSLSSSFPQRNFHSIGSSSKVISQEHIVTTMFAGNFIGIVFARSLHYQFYSWYFYSLPYLLWRTPFPTLLRIILFVGVEVCWNVYPSNIISSVLLLCLHLIILWGLWCAPPEYPYVKAESSSGKKEE